MKNKTRTTAASCGYGSRGVKTRVMKMERLGMGRAERASSGLMAAERRETGGPVCKKAGGILLSVSGR